MSNANIVTSQKLGVDFYTTDTDRKHKLGTTCLGSNGSEWIYVQAAGAVAQYATVTIDEAYQATALAAAGADDGHDIGFAQVAFADDEFGWVAKRGLGIKVLVKASCAADVRLFTSNSAGILDDASSGQTEIFGIVITTAATASGVQAEDAIATWPGAALSP